MKPEKALETVNRIIALSPEKKLILDVIEHNEKFSKPEMQWQFISNLYLELKDEITRTEAKVTGNTKRLQAAKRILKSVPDCKECLQFAYIKDNKQYFTDGVRAAILTDFLPLPELPSNLHYVDTIIFDRLTDNTNAKILPTPDINKLQAYIKIEKAKGNKKPLYCFGENTTVCSAHYLLDMLYIIPNAEIYFSGRLTPIIFTNNTDNKAILMPVRSDINTATELD